MVHCGSGEPNAVGATRSTALPILGADPGLGGRYLRVITLADKVTILNAFPDRGFKP